MHTDTLPIAERSPRATHPMTAPEARWLILLMEEQVLSEAKRRRHAAIFAINPRGKLSDEAVAVYAAYARGEWA